VAAGQREAVPRAEPEAVQHEPEPQPAAARAEQGDAAVAVLPGAAEAPGAVAEQLPAVVAEGPGAAVAQQPVVAVAGPGAAEARLPAVVVAGAPGAAAGPQPEAVVGAEQDGAVRRQAVAPSGPPWVSVCRPGRLRRREPALAPRPAALFARRKRSSQPTSP